MKNPLTGIPSQSSFYKINLGENSFSYEVHSHGEKKIIFLHGWCAAKYFWTPVLEEFLDLGECITMDLLGHYPSRIASGFESFTPEDLYRIQAEGIQKIAGEEKVILIGHSTGGMFALAIHAMYPDLVEKSIAITPVIHGPVKGLLSFAKVMADLKMSFSLDLSFEILKRFPNLFHFWFEQAVYDGKGFVQREDVKEFIEAYRPHFLKLNPYTMGTYLQILNQSDLTPLLEKTKIKSLVIGGKEDKVVPVTQCHHIKEKCNYLDYKEFVHSGHIPLFEEKEECVQYMIDWILNT